MQAADSSLTDDGNILGLMCVSTRNETFEVNFY